MKKIHKYKLGIGGYTSIYTDRFKEILHVANQPEEGPQMWALIDENERLKTFEIQSIGTGWPIPEGFEFIGTVVEDNGYVWHYFMREIIAAEWVLSKPAILAFAAKAKAEIENAYAA